MDNKKKVDLVEEARQMRLQLEALEKKVQLARGTQRVKKPTQQVVVKPSGPYYVGDEGPTEELMEVIADMLRERPWRFTELLEATGARDNRIKGVIMRLQREGVRVVDVSTVPGKAHWFIPNDEVLKRVERAKKLATAKR